MRQSKKRGNLEGKSELWGPWEQKWQIQWRRKSWRNLKKGSKTTTRGEKVRTSKNNREWLQSLSIPNNGDLGKEVRKSRAVFQKYYQIFFFFSPNWRTWAWRLKVFMKCSTHSGLSLRRSRWQGKHRGSYKFPAGVEKSHRGRRSQKGVRFLNSSPETKDNGDTASKTREEIFLIDQRTEFQGGSQQHIKWGRKFKGNTLLPNLKAIHYCFPSREISEVEWWV